MHDDDGLYPRKGMDELDREFRDNPKRLIPLREAAVSAWAKMDELDRAAETLADHEMTYEARGFIPSEHDLNAVAVFLSGRAQTAPPITREYIVRALVMKLGRTPRGAAFLEAITDAVGGAVPWLAGGEA